MKRGGSIRSLLSLTLLLLAWPCRAAISPCVKIAITPAAIPNASTGVAYSQRLTATGGAGGMFGFAITSQGLPPGLSLTNATATTVDIIGTPTVAGSYPFTVSATTTSAPGGCSGGRTYQIQVSGPISYSTSFDVDESPLSEGGKWKHNNPWFTKVVANGGKAYGTQPNPANPGLYEDSYAFLGGMGFPPNQYASAHIHKSATIGGYMEVELQLRVSDSANSTRGYECFLHQAGAYISIARWSGAPMSGPAGITYFDILGGADNVTAPQDGDLFEAQIVGNIVTVKLAGSTLLTLDVSQFDGVVINSGDPGIGFDAGGSGAETPNASYGFKDFFAKGL
jgi:hypothetical protein